MRASILLIPTALVLALSACKPTVTADAQAAEAPVAVAASGPSDAELLAQGEYLVRIAGCNDCHTPGWAQNGGDAPREQWLVGSPVGWKGPWGTTYAVNLRLKAADMDDKQWLDYTANLHTRPPMPDFAVRTLKEQDRLALFRFIKSLGPGGQPAPAYLPPGQEPPLPYFQANFPPPPAAAQADAKPAAAG
jgi:mono/diheme cytochrome c family protein